MFTKDVQNNALLLSRRKRLNCWKKINSGFPVEKWERLDFLDSKMEHSALLEEEHAELMALNEANEAYMVRRLVLLGQLAELRKTTLREVMKQLGIRHESDV